MKKLLILSGKGGTGKTTVAAAFIELLRASAFADCDVDAPNLHLVVKPGQQSECTDYYGSKKAAIDPSKCIGCSVCLDKCRFDAITLLNGKCEVNQFACEGCGVCEYVCPENAVVMNGDIAGERQLYGGKQVFSTARLKMGRGNSGKLVTEVKTALFKTAPDAELAVIDGSPGVGCPVIASVSGVSLVLIVAEPSISGIHDMERILKTTAFLGARAAVCINKYDISPANTGAIEEYCSEKNIPFLGRIPYDRHASAAINSAHTLAEIDCPARTAIKGILERVLIELNRKELTPAQKWV